MSDVKELLKEAKTELSRGDYEEAIAVSKKVLKIDKKNYFAYVFLGKLYSVNSDLKDLGLATESYIKATNIEPDNILAWKGLFLLLEQQSERIIPDVVDYKKYFSLCNKYMKLLQQQGLSQVELINSIKALKTQNKSNTSFLEEFYKYFKPGNASYETLGKHLVTQIESLTGLIKIVKKRETEEISSIVSQQRLKLSASDPNYQFKINSLAWNIYEDSYLDEYYNQLINIVDDDTERGALEDEWLQYRIKVLKSMPSDIKQEFFKKVKSMVDGMILVNHNSLIAWKYFFDWQDFENLDEMDPKIIIKFFLKYPTEPLAIILYAWINSKYSSYDIKALEKDMDINMKESDVSNNVTDEFKNDENAAEEEEELNYLLEVEEETSGLLKEEDILISLIDNISKTKNSAIASRIIAHYYMLNQEYSASLPYIKAGITLISYNLRDLGANLKNSKRELTINIATCYTYVDAPRNHKSALSLFDKILSEDPDNIKSEIGKSIISIEREDWQNAHDLLNNVVIQTPSNLEVLSQLAWCKGHLNELDQAIEIFTTVINKIEGTDMRTMDIKATNLWRQAKIYILKQESTSDITDLRYVHGAFKLLIQIIKYCSDTFAKSYSTLGDLYSQYFKDNNRAFKCYFKAFELDSGDVVAATFVTKVYCDSGNWTAAAQIAERLIKEENATNILRKVNWPYRVVGVSYLEKQMDSESIEWFQSAIRVDPNDVESWIGLGQAYLSGGRIEASIKVFEKSLELDSQHPFAKYFYSKALSEIGEFEKSILILEELCEMSPEEETFNMLLAEQLVSYSYDLYDQGYLMKSNATTVKAIEVVKIVICELKCFTQNIWIILSKALYLFSLVESKIEKLPIESLVEIFQEYELKNTEDLDSIENITIDTLLADDKADNVSITAQLLILSAKYAVSSSSFDQLTATVKSACWYNIGITELIGYITLNEEKFREAAILALKRSIKYQSNNIESWVALGMATMDINYRVSQHCFIKAAALSPKDVNIWFNLAILGLKNNDIRFSSQIITKTQSLEPQNSSPWLGFALIKEREGDHHGSHTMFGHSFVLSNGRSKISQLLYAKSVLKTRIGNGNDERDIDALEELSAITYGLEQYFKKKPNDPYAIQCSLLALERLHNYSKAKSLCNRLIELLEKRFEILQDDSELFNFALIKSQLARIQLGLGDYDDAIENATLSDGILLDYETTTIYESKGLASQISNHVCLGLANFFKDNFEETLNHFQKLLELSKDSGSLVTLLSKVLYDVGTEEAKAIALQELVEYTSSHDFDILTTLLIGAITLLENKDDDMNTVLSHLKNLSLNNILSDNHRDIPYLVSEFEKRLQKKDASKSNLISTNIFSQRTAFLFPQNNESWEGIDKKIKQRVASDGQNKVTAEQLSDLYCNNGNLKNIQKAAFLCPWNKKAIVSIKECF